MRALWPRGLLPRQRTSPPGRWALVPRSFPVSEDTLGRPSVFRSGPIWPWCPRRWRFRRDWASVPVPVAPCPRRWRWRWRWRSLPVSSFRCVVRCPRRWRCRRDWVGRERFLRLWGSAPWCVWTGRAGVVLPQRDGRGRHRRRSSRRNDRRNGRRGRRSGRRLRRRRGRNGLRSLRLRLLGHRHSLRLRLRLLPRRKRTRRKANRRRRRWTCKMLKFFLRFGFRLRRRRPLPRGDMMADRRRMDERVKKLRRR
mmetsp:Transcript_38989/g.90703  ORF Transcript_38989/g.90703 Transcript_38989/m.90703 type:complete len:253 (-) Transcript_38989:15-773(-)